tara:strand:+ start:453 stop:572 length:120 start_codon:yes stop_codon:yes gene_type:complete
VPKCDATPDGEVLMPLNDNAMSVLLTGILLLLTIPEAAI